MIKIIDDSQNSKTYQYLFEIGYFDHNATGPIDVSYDYTSSRINGIFMKFML
jgi:hypothetical protein